MKRIILLLAMLCGGYSATFAVSAPTNYTGENLVLLIDPSSMLVAAGKATLLIGELQRTDGICTGNYRIKVSPYFFKNERGRLAIVISDASLAGIHQGKITILSGTATTSGNHGKCRPIEATVMPVDKVHGTLKVCFTAGNRKMIFAPTYHVVEKGMAAIPVQTAETYSPAGWQVRLLISQPETLQTSVSNL
jgi:hypothetical protein